MSEFKAENYLILLADPDFSVLAGKAIDKQLQSELLVNVFPQGSSWKKYAGTRSISFFRSKTYPDTYALTYSVITSSIDTPVISFVILVDSKKAEIVLSRHVKGIESIFIQKIDKFFSIDAKTAQILKDNLLFYKSSPTIEKSEMPRKYAEQKQILFSMPYLNPHQWTNTETAIVKFVLEKSSPNFFSFRTFALQKEPAFKVLGIIQKPKDNQQEKFMKAIVIFTIIATLLILAVLSLLVYFGIINFNNNASQQSVHWTLGILTYFQTFFSL